MKLQMTPASRGEIGAEKGMEMKEKQFWELIDLIDQEHLDSDDDRAVTELITALACSPDRDIEAFEDHLHAVLFSLDGEDYMEESGETSGDGFLYCRCYVVARGLNYYTSVLNRAAKMQLKWFETLLYVASKAWGKKTGRKFQDWEFVSSIDCETGCNRSRWSEIAVAVPQLTPQQAEEQRELEYQRVVSKVVHMWNAGNYGYVVEMLEPHAARLSKKLLNMLNEARSKLLKD